ILSGRKQEKDWLELLFEMIDDNNAPANNGQRFLSVGFCLYDKNHHAFICQGTSDDYTPCVKLSR
ncbi:MAG: hypothetical protein GY737_30010, partial [Desulfobacteraceae bacterium]|nr:hypothetical protein [Desulfobacteraceae bacterium]